MPGSEATVLDKVLEGFLQPEQADGVRHCGTVFPCALGDVLLRQVEVHGQAFKGPRLLYRVEVLSLDVFNQRDLEGHLLRHFADDGRDAR